MFDDPFVFFALVIAIVALIFARKAMNQVAELRQRLEAIQAAPAAAARGDVSSASSRVRSAAT